MAWNTTQQAALPRGVEALLQALDPSALDAERRLGFLFVEAAMRVGIDARQVAGPARLDRHEAVSGRRQGGGVPVEKGRAEAGDLGGGARPQGRRGRPLARRLPT